ncbi:MICAL-like protein 2a isoform X2 [Oryzias melastigma]|uniref:MICAL-like protein 2a isoform X2 n=1 Tax=Oryzias melastigma TaxID=30732 RepID=UPI00168D14FA|nr:MICAL-like protein 2a isoform X2 [Oryzias melastigma]XP_036069088.1 MICAL-like protein 2a isoform X2 [Oryzias melastigma]
MAAIKALELWCKLQCEGYRDVTITNMTTSFRNGLAFCALIHKFRPDLIDYDSLKKEDVFENNRLAFQVAEEKLGIPALLDAEDMVALRIPDRLSILTYVSQYYNYFKGCTPIGGVKRPAEGSKEEPSEKKNLPILAKTFTSKKDSEKCLAFTDQTSSKVGRAAAQKVVLSNSHNKNGTLTSKCVECKSHVHLVQRHFVEGKLYHRSCFKCCECGGVLHVGGYQPGKNPDMFVCNAHKDGSKPSEDEGKNGFTTSPKTSTPSVLTAPLPAAAKPLSAAPPPSSWTASAQKTQAARQRFFQSQPETSTEVRKPIESSEKSGARTAGRKLAEENRNNNNKRPFTVRSAETRFSEEPNSADRCSQRRDKCGQSSAGNGSGELSINRKEKEAPVLKVINQDDFRPTAVHKSTKDLISHERRTPRLKTEERLRDTPPGAVTEQHAHEFMSTAPCHVPISATRPPSAQTPAVPAVCFALVGPAGLRDASPQKPTPASESLDFKYGSHLAVKSSLRPPAEQSINSLSTAPSNSGNPSAAKKGKYLSPTNAFRTEMRSPSVKSYHIPVEQIEKQLMEIETNLAHLEKEGVELEKKLRRCEEEGEGDILMDPLMVDWFNLIRKKQMYIRKESELVYIARTQELEEQQPNVEGELRMLLEKPDHLKSREEKRREKTLMQRLMEIVDGRNAIVEGLDEDRRREVEEDLQLNKMMQNLGTRIFSNGSQARSHN